jgi:hypothetical protein
MLVSRTTGPEKCKLHANFVVQIQVCSIHNQQELDEVTIRKLIFAHCFGILFKHHLTNFNQIWYKSSLGKGNSRLSNTGPGPFSKGRSS